jgi:hypothetical protein
LAPHPLESADDEHAGVSWPILLLSSYASAVTIALVWILWTGRSLPPPRTADTTAKPSSSSTRSRAPGPAITAERAPLLPARNVTSLGKPLRLDTLEVEPFSIVRRQVDLVRLDGTTGEYRGSPDALVLSVRLTNHSKTDELTPLDPTFVRELGSSADESFIELSSDRRVAMFHLAPESEWSIQDQAFPTLKPGESAETIIVSEPVRLSELPGPLTWRIRLRTSTFQTDVIGVRFSATDIVDEAW